MTQLDFGAPHRHIDIGHSQIAYWRIGSGPDLVFVHGWPLHAATFRDIAPRLAQHYTCHLIDLPGAGQTRWADDTPVSIQDHAETVLAVVRKLGLKRYGYVAHDSGGAVARFAAARDPKGVTSIVLGNTEIPGHHAALVDAYVQLMKVPGAKLATRLMMRSRTLRHSRLMFGGCFDDVSRLDGEFHDLYVQPQIDDARIADGQSKLINGMDTDVFDALKGAHAQVQAPVLLIWGPDCHFFPIDKAREMLDQFAGGAELIALPRGKVFAHEELPGAFSDHALAFLQQHVCASAPWVFPTHSAAAS